MSFGGCKKLPQRYCFKAEVSIAWRWAFSISVVHVFGAYRLSRRYWHLVPTLTFQYVRAASQWGSLTLPTRQMARLPVVTA